jgi:L-amino acid N-acyltransferase YncA
VRIPGVGVCGSFSDRILVSDAELDPRAPAWQISVREATSLEGIGQLLASRLDHEGRLRRGDVCLVAWMEEGPVGVYWLNYGTRQDSRLGDTRCSDRYVYANQLLVEQQCRGRGVGTTLASAARRHAMQQGARDVVCAVPVGNQASFVAHRAAGFLETGVVRGLRFGERYVRVAGGIQGRLR